MKNRDSLSDRMKENYENRAKTYLMRRTPVIIRCDGKSFGNFTRGLKKPYDEIFRGAMIDTMKYLCENIQGCKLGYTQSDEITLLLTDYDTLTTAAWFDNGVQKICSVAASMATLAFNKAFREYSRGTLRRINECFTCTKEEEKYAVALEKCLDKGAMFDARCFNIPEDEVTNCFIWREQDATRNAVQMLGQCYFSQKELNGKSTDEIKNMLTTEKGVNFGDMPAEFKYGVCCIKKTMQDERVDVKDGARPVKRWIVDKEIPIFSEDRDYIESAFGPVAEEE